MTDCYRINYPGGTGYTSDKTVYDVVSECIATDKIPSTKWSAKVVAYKEDFRSQDGGCLNLIKGGMGEDSWITVKREWVLNSFLAAPLRVCEVHQILNNTVLE
jgi:hypothetical protein